MKYAPTDWNTYRTRFLVRARQLTEPLVFMDSLGREHQGDIGDYLVQSSDGTYRIAPREIFEDIYVSMGPADDSHWPVATHPSLSSLPESVSKVALSSPPRSVMRTAGSAFS